MGLIDSAKTFLGILGSFFGFRQKNNQNIPTGVIEKEFNALPAASREMDDNINLWYAMYINQPPWADCDVRPLGFPGSIGRELSRHALTEFSVTVSGSARADFINEQMQTAAENFSKNLELGLCLGGIAFRPYADRNRILVEAYTTAFTPTQFDGAGKCTGGVFKSNPVRQGNEWYIKLEYHTFQTAEDGTSIYTIENRAFRSSKDGSIGAAVHLDSVEAWRGLNDKTTLGYLDGPLFAYFRPPMANRIEPGSNMGVSVYSGEVAELIKQADEQWERIWWEFKSGERKIFSDGSIEPGQLSDRLFIRGAFTPEANLFQEFGPTFRNSELYEGFQYILKEIEFCTGLAFGTISDPQYVEKTATEAIITKHRQYVTEGDIQKAFEKTLNDLIYAMNAWCDLAQLAPAGNYKVDYNWGDGILDDPETKQREMEMDLRLVASGIMGPVEWRMKHFKEDEETARRMLPGMEELNTERQNEIGA